MAAPSIQTLQRIASETGYQTDTLEKVIRLLAILFEVAATPIADGHVAQAHASGEGGVRLALGAVEHDPGSLHGLMRQ